MPDDAMTTARLEFCHEIRDDIMEAIDASLDRHGDDPQAHILVAGSICMVIHILTDIADPTFKAMFTELLKISDTSNAVRGSPRSRRARQTR